MNNDGKDVLFETASPMDEIKVRLTQDRFYNHIIVDHPEMKGHEKDIQETIEKPNIIQIAKRFPEKRRHFMRKTHKNELSVYNNVIVEIDTEQTAHVTTSFYSEDIGGGGDYVYFKYDNKV